MRREDFRSAFPGFDLRPRRAKRGDPPGGFAAAGVSIVAESQNRRIPQGSKIHLHYVFGTALAMHQTPTEENEDVDPANRDKAGNLLTGRKLDTSELQPGNYRLVDGRDSRGRA